MMKRKNILGTLISDEKFHAYGNVVGEFLKENK